MNRSFTARASRIGAALGLAALAFAATAPSAQAYVLVDARATTASGTDIDTGIPYADAASSTANASAYAYADLSTGKVGAASSSTLFPDHSYDIGQASAQWYDTITFDLNGAASAVVNVSFVVDGDLAAFNGVYNNYFSWAFGVSETDGVGGLFSGTGFVTDYGLLTNSPQLTSFERAGRSDVTGLTAYGVTGSFTVLPDLHYQINAVLTTHGTADFSHTGTFRFSSLPPGVTFTSESQQFLTNVGTGGAVPEPATWALMIGGFGLAGATLRRRRQVRA